MIDEEQMDVERALRCMNAEVDEVGHWPTVASVLGEEVLRLRKALESVPLSAQKFDAAEQSADVQEFVHQQMIEALLLVTSAVAEKGSQPATGRLLSQASGHLRRAIGLDPQYANASVN